MGKQVRRGVQSPLGAEFPRLVSSRPHPLPPCPQGGLWGRPARLTHRSLALVGVIWPLSRSRAGRPLPGRPTALFQAPGAEAPGGAGPALTSCHLLSFQSQHHPRPLLRPGVCSEEEDCQQALNFLGGGTGGPHDLWYLETYLAPPRTCFPGPRTSLRPPLLWVNRSGGGRAREGGWKSPRAQRWH